MIYIYIYHDHHKVLLSRQQYLLSITPSRSSRLHPVSAQNCCRTVLGGRPTFARSCEWIHSNTSLMSLPLLLHQCPACLDRITWIVFVIAVLIQPLLVKSCLLFYQSLLISIWPIAVHASASCVLMSFSVDETLNVSTISDELPFVWICRLFD